MSNPTDTSNAGPPGGRRCTAFDGIHRLAAGALSDVALAVARAMRRGDAGTLLVFDDATGAVVDIDWRGTDAEIIERYRQLEPAPRGPGRPRLGVVAREITLLPSQWEWLGRQPGGASVTLRKLVEEARRADPRRDASRLAREATYRFLHAIGGDLPHFEEISRALFARDDDAVATLLASWPEDIRAHALVMLQATSTG